MFSKDRWKEILEVLSSNMLRTVATAFGVGWGIFILIILLAAGKGLENGIRQDFNGVATNTMFMWTKTTTMAYEGLPEGRNYSFKIEDVALLRKNVPELRIISPRNVLFPSGNDNVVRGVESGQYRVWGDYPDIVEQRPMYITYGRFINHNDIDEKQKIIVIGDGVRKDLYKKDEEVLGSYVKIKGINFMVVGIYKERTSGGGGENSEMEIFMPFTTFSQAYNKADNVNRFSLTAKDGSSISDLREAIIGTIKKGRRIHPEDDRAVGFFDLYEQYNRVESLFGALKFVAYFVGILVLLSGIIGVSNIMLIAIKERTKEIGIRRALGESPWSIKLQIIMESIFLTLLSGMTGIIFGALFIYGINTALEAIGPIDMFLNPTISLGVVLAALFILVISGLLAGFIPANSAIKVRPIEALRME